MQNLFSIFDPVAIIKVEFNWLSSILVLLVLYPSQFWIGLTSVGMRLKFLRSILFNEFKIIILPIFYPGALIVRISLFFFIWLNNFLGIVPYIFTSSSHLSFTLSIGLPLWLGHVIFAWLKSCDLIWSHLVPLGSPMALSPFIVIIELIRRVIRPVTLSIRLAANIVAGHLLIALLRSPIFSRGYLMGLIILRILSLLLVLELAVALIQSYVFRILTVLYVNEVNSHLLN